MTVDLTTIDPNADLLEVATSGIARPGSGMAGFVATVDDASANLKYVSPAALWASLPQYFDNGLTVTQAGTRCMRALPDRFEFLPRYPVDTGDYAWRFKSDDYGAYRTQVLYVGAHYVNDSQLIGVSDSGDPLAPGQRSCTFGFVQSYASAPNCVPIFSNFLAGPGGVRAESDNNRKCLVTLGESKSNGITWENQTATSRVRFPDATHSPIFQYLRSTGVYSDLLLYTAAAVAWGNADVPQAFNAGTDFTVKIGGANRSKQTDGFLYVTTPGSGRVALGNIPSYTDYGALWLAVAEGAETAFNYVIASNGTTTQFRGINSTAFQSGADHNFYISAVQKLKVDAARASFTFGASTGAVVLREHPSLPAYGTIWLGVAAGSETVNNYALTGTGVTTVLKATTVVQFNTGEYIEEVWNTGTVQRRLPTVTTTNATVTTIRTETINANECVTFRATWNGKTSGGDHCILRQEFTVRRKASAAPTQLGTTNNLIAIAKDDAAWGTPDWTISGNNVLFRVTGKAATSIVWTLHLERLTQ